MSSTTSTDADHSGLDPRSDTERATPATPEVAVVLEFLDALERNDADTALALLADTVTYQNVPFPAARGKKKVEKQLRAMTRVFSQFEVENHNVASNGPVVLTERTDALSIGPLRGAFWVCGTFEVHDGKITLWRDRFDFVDLMLSVVRGLGLAVFKKR